MYDFNSHKNSMKVENCIKVKQDQKVENDPRLNNIRSLRRVSRRQLKKEHFHHIKYYCTNR